MSIEILAMETNELRGTDSTPGKDDIRKLKKDAEQAIGDAEEGLGR